MMPAKQFYVYLIRDPRAGKNNVPVYVGKGNEGRIHTHWRLAENHYNSFLRRVFGKIRKAGLVPLIEILCYFDNEADAFRYEMELIVEYGRRDLGNGSLCNLTNGGEGTAGCLATIENMRKLNANPEFKEATVTRNRELMRRRNADPEFVKAKSERARARHTDPTFAKAWAEGASTRVRIRNADPEFQRICHESKRKKREEKRLIADAETNLRIQKITIHYT